MMPFQVYFGRASYLRIGTAQMKLLLAVFALAGIIAAEPPKVAMLLSRDLPELAGKETTMLTVELAPGGKGDVHRHNAHVFVYVLEGSIVMQVKGGKQVTLGVGETFYENPQDIHVVGRNASDSKPAKFLVFMIKQKGAPIATPSK
jgi:quercetin dioxygenase-like cupin family protein